MRESLHDAASAYVAELARDHRRAHGVVYTPSPVADFILDQAMGPGLAPDGAVLDPACGAGAFLLPLVSRIACRFDGLGVDIKRGGRREFLREIRRTVWGIDIDPHAVDLTRFNLRSAIESASPGPLPLDFMNENVRTGDFLNANPLAFVKGPVSYIVGNPPYVSTDRISSSDKGAYRERFATAFGRIDLYTLFMEQATRALGEAGVWVFITPDKYLSSESARPIREFLRHRGSVRKLAIFDSHRVFAKAATVPCITVWQAGAEPSPELTVDHIEIPDAKTGFPRAVSSSTQSSTRLAEKQWNFLRKDEEALARRIGAGTPPLREHAIRVSAGWTTGYNPAFLFDHESADQVEHQLLHPTVRGRDIQANRIHDRGDYMLVPYVWRDGAPGELIDLDAYPKARRWLKHHRTRLEQRHCVRKWGKDWWDLHDPMSEPLHRIPKVLVPDVARSNRFAADEGRFVPQHSVYYIVPRDIDAKVLAALLNSPPLEFLVRVKAPVVKDGFSRYRRQFLLDLPVPELDADTQAEIARAVREERHDDLSTLTSNMFGVEAVDVEHALQRLHCGR